MGRTIYLTTPLYYVNAEPHIGHTYTTVLVDTLTRYHRMMGDRAYFQTGTDEHGEKIVQAAQKRGIEPQEHVDRISNIFARTWQEIGIECDDFIRTTQPRHKALVQEVLQRVKDKGDIYFDEYTGLYCVGCERYLTSTELVDGKCPDHEVEPKEVKEANYFFNMEKYKGRLIEHIEANPDWIRPERFRNEVLSFLKQPLEPLCISRPKSRLEWGIELPFDDGFVTYVWFDALLNYVSAVKKTAKGEDLFDELWPACNHFIAKDILKTHAIYWPTMLLAADIPLFKQLDVHGYWLAGDSKMSKSLGNVVRPGSFDRHFGIENLRYFFFREMKFGRDSNFTYELFVERYNSDLANGLGNLLSRVSSICKKNRKGAISPFAEATAAEEALIDKAATVAQRYPEHFEQRDFHLAVEEIRGLLGATDNYINTTAPWKLAKDPERGEELDRVLYTGLEVVRIASVLLHPIMPNTTRAILDYLGDGRPTDGSVPWKELTAWGGVPSGHILGDVPRMFPRIDEKKLSEVIAEAQAEAARATAEAAGAAPVRGDFEPIAEEIAIDDFGKLDLRVGVVRDAALVEGADKLLRLMVDIGEERPRQVFAGIRSAYPDPKVLEGQQVIVVANLKPRKMKFGLSEGMVLAGGGGTERLCTATFKGEMRPGDKVS